MMKKIPAIYTITIPTGDFYLGSTVNAYMRKCQHFSNLKHGTHNNAALIEAYEKYGKDGLKFEVIFSLLPGSNKFDIEQEFLNELKPKLNGTLLAHSPMRDPNVAAKTAKTLREGKQYIDQLNSIRHLANKALRKPVIRVTDGMRFESGQDAARYMGYTKRIGDIATAIRQKTRCKNGHFWIFEGSSETLQTLEAAEEKRKNNMKNNSRPVIRLRDGVRFESAKAAAIAHGRASGHLIINAIERGGLCGGEKWAYA